MFVSRGKIYFIIIIILVFHVSPCAFTKSEHFLRSKLWWILICIIKGFRVHYLKCLNDCSATLYYVEIDMWWSRKSFDQLLKRNKRIGIVVLNRCVCFVFPSYCPYDTSFDLRGRENDLHEVLHLSTIALKKTAADKPTTCVWQNGFVTINYTRCIGVLIALSSHYLYPVAWLMRIQLNSYLIAYLYNIICFLRVQLFCILFVF